MSTQKADTGYQPKALSLPKAQDGEFHWAGAVGECKAGGSGVTVGPVAGLV